ncbi:DUF4097 family beta strand repeat-containing protein [Salibacterium aidingense]|uniref:DUF4097 family beta strand repeat-containing protein n=1 Tax=Salibacterium aidingense TaxID=384933 RepID=UPI003BE839CC
MKKLGGMILITAGLVMLVCSVIDHFPAAFSVSEKRGQEETIPWQNEATVEIQVESQDVVINRHDENTITIRSRHGSDLESLQTDTAEPNSLNIQEEKEGWLSGLGWTGKQGEWEILLPDSFSGNLSVNGASSDVLFDNHHQEALDSLSIEVASGDVEIGEIKVNHLQHSAQSGDLTAAEVETKQASVKTVSGDMEIEGWNGPLSAMLTSGDMDVQWSEFASSSIEVTSGDVEAEVGNAGLRLECSVSSGDIQNELPLQDIEQTQQSLKGQRGDNGGLLSISSVSGDIHISE